MHYIFVLNIETCKILLFWASNIMLDTEASLKQMFEKVQHVLFQTLQ